MSDRNTNNQFPAGSLTPEQISQLNNLFNLNLGAPVAVQNLFNQLIQNQFTQRLQHQLQQIVQQSSSTRQPPQPPQPPQQQQPHANLQPSLSIAGNGQPGLSMRGQPSAPGSLQLATGGQQTEQPRRKRGRPPLSAPSTSAGPSTVGYNYLNMLAKNQPKQPDDRQREFRQQQEYQEKALEAIRQYREREIREREHRQQQERLRQVQLVVEQQRAERQRSIERERLRVEAERQRKAQQRQALQDIERERRRQHMIMLRNLEAYKRNEQREKTMEAMMAERNKQIERRMYQKRLEAELIKEIRKPVDDMSLKHQKPLATLNRIPGLKLPGKAFADLLMSYEFLYNFGETIGVELRDIPDIDTLQLGLMNLNGGAEDKLVSVLFNICMFAIKDPRFPYTGSTKEIENLDVNNEGLSQLIHFYLQVLTLNAKTDMEHELRLYKLIQQKYFLSLNASQKAEIFAFLCNELLCSQSVTRQVEETIENVAKLRKDKWVLENEIRKYRAIKTKRELREEAELRAKEAAEAAATLAANDDAEKAEDDKIIDSNNKPDNKREDEVKPDKANMTNGSTVELKRENEMDLSSHNNVSAFDDPEPDMSNDELYKKLDNLTKQFNKTSNKLEKAINSMRASPLGQDRFRRRYWVLPQVGGVFVEGLESTEPEESEKNKFTEEELVEYEKEEQQYLAELNNNSNGHDVEIGAEPHGEGEIEDPNKAELRAEDEMDVKVEGPYIKDEEEPMDLKDEEHEVTETKDDESKVGDLINGKQDEDETAVDNTGPEPIEQIANSVPVSNIPWFSILPRVSCDLHQKSNEGKESDESQNKVRDEVGIEEKPEPTNEDLKAMRHDICPALARRLEELEAEQYETPKKIHPQFQCGWWRITDIQQLKVILNALHERGSRERVLHKHLTKHFQYACNSTKNTTVDFEITSIDRHLAGKNYGAPMPHTDEDSADDLRLEDEEEEEEEDGEDFDEDAVDEKATIQQAASAPTRRSKRKKTLNSARSRRLRARAAARKKVENSRNKLAQR